MAPSAAPMGGGGNIKVVVRCRPFNGRGECLYIYANASVASALSEKGNPWNAARPYVMQTDTDDATIRFQNTTAAQNVSSR